jgi:hypothetical protein
MVGDVARLVLKQTTNKPGRTIMADNRTQDYWEDDNEGHVDTRHFNHECENSDPNLGCNLGMDVAG